MEQKKKWKFNIVDVAVLVILLAAVAFLAVKLTQSRADKLDASGRPTASENMAVARFVVEVDGVRKELYDRIAEQLPAQLLASGKLANGIIESASSEPCTLLSVESSNPVNATETVVLVPDPSVEYVNAFFTILAPVDLNTDTNVSLSQELRLGRIYYIKSRYVELTGTIVDLTVDVNMDTELAEVEEEPETEQAGK